MPAVAALLARTRAHGGQSHPGGMQWWLRELGREGFEAFVVDGATPQSTSGFVLIDGNWVFAVADARPDGLQALELTMWAEEHLRSKGVDAILASTLRVEPLTAELEARGYVPGEIELELMRDIEAEPTPASLPDGFGFVSLEAVGDAAFIDMHVAAWSDERPSSYRLELHEAVRRMPDFRPELVTILAAPDGTPASYCIGWADALSETLEIEPLGTHRDYRRLGLARAVVDEVSHRAWQHGMKHVLVWNRPQRNPAAYRLYTSAGMTARREVVQLRKVLT